MKTKLFSLFLALAASVGTASASLISITDNSIDDWNNLPANYVFESVCPTVATFLGLRSVKVYADLEYLCVLVEPNMAEIVDLDWVPFHIYINTDNSDLTGGYGDEFTDANTDIVLEGAVFAGNPYPFNPYVFKWWGEVGGNGWDWTDPGVEHSGDDCWGALICEGQFPDCSSQMVNGKIEIKINYHNIPATWNDSEFGIGFDIMQNWSSVGILPLVSPTYENPSGKTNKMQIQIHQVSSFHPIADGIEYLLNNTDYTAIVISHDYSGIITIPSQVSYNDNLYTVVGIGEDAFRDCVGLTGIIIPNSVTSIGDRAFSGCSGLTSITIPNSVTSIGERAFSGCSGFTSITIPNSVTSIGDCAFVLCKNLTTVNIPNSVTNIGRYIFEGSEKLTSIVAPAKIFEGIYSSKHVENVCVNGGELTESAFEYIALSYKTLKSIDVSATTNTELADEAFNGCYNLESLVLPANLSEISYMAVAGCKSLQAINIPASVTEIGPSAFENCRSLSAVNFAANPAITSIGNWAFYNCHALQNIAIPDGVTSIGSGAFYGCTYLAELTLPASVQHIGDNAFALCSRMQKITVDAVVPPTIADKSFFEVSLQMPVYVPEASVQAYQADPLWGRMNIIGAHTGLESATAQSTAVYKQLINGQLFILLPDGSKYSATGVKVE